MLWFNTALAGAESLHPCKRRWSFLLWLVFFWPVSAGTAFAVTLPFNDSFTGADASTLVSPWIISDQDGSAGSYHEIGDNKLLVAAGGDTAFIDNYSLYVDNIRGNFTVIVQVVSATSTGVGSLSGIQVQNDLGNSSNHRGHVQLVVMPGTGCLLISDIEGDGIANVTMNSGIPPAFPVWLRLVRNGSGYAGAYSYDAKTWNSLGTLGVGTSTPEVSVGLFSIAGGTGATGPLTRAVFDNFSLVGSTTTHLFFRDADADTFGDPNATFVHSSATPPAGYTTNNEDCDDKRASVNPNGSEICDGIDNDCDGNIDEGSQRQTYYQDSDNDGYGSTLNTRQACVAPSGYTSVGGDCDDSNAAVNPGMADICGDTIDQDCNGEDAVCASSSVCDPIPEIPLGVSVPTPPPIIMILYDNSLSMQSDMLCPEHNGEFNGSMNGAGGDRVEVLAAEYLERISRGESPDMEAMASGLTDEDQESFRQLVAKYRKSD